MESWSPLELHRSWEMTGRRKIETCGEGLVVGRRTPGVDSLLKRQGLQLAKTGSPPRKKGPPSFQDVL